MAERMPDERATAARGTARGSSGKLRAVAAERGLGQRGPNAEAGNPGAQLGTESRDGVQYVRYRATVGTWISASLKQQGYDQEYGRLSGYGAYVGIVKDADGKPLKSPDRIEPGQEYLIPLRNTPAPKPVSFGEQLVVGYRTPQTQVQTKSEPQNPLERWAKDRFVATRDMPYGTYELKGPPPPSRVPRDAVEFWLRRHQSLIVKAETDWHVSRLSIAGAIAWEALENPQAFSFSSVSPGKLHYTRTDGYLSWPEVVELTGRIKTPFTPNMRLEYLSTPEGAIQYIAAIMDFIATVAEARDWNIRNNPEILAQVYHSRTAEQWIDFMRTKPANAPFVVVPGTMGKWILDNMNYLEKAVGPAEKW